MPQKPLFGGVNRRIQAKSASYNYRIIETASNPTMLILHNDKDDQVLFAGGPICVR